MYSYWYNFCRKCFYLKFFSVSKWNHQQLFFSAKNFSFGKKISKTGPQIVKFSTFLKYSWGWKYPRKKVEKLSIIVVKSKCRRKVPKSSTTIYFCEKIFLAKIFRKQVRKSSSFRLFWKQIEAGNISTNFFNFWSKK